VTLFREVVIVYPTNVFQATYKGWIDIIRDAVDSPNQVRV